MRVYLVQELGFEYNDEVYNRLDDDFGKPVLAYKDKNKAIEKCRELNRKAFVENDIRDYCYDMADVSSLDVDEIERRLRSIYGDGYEVQWRSWEFELPESTDEQINEVIKIFDLLTFYYVEEVDCE